MGVCIAKELVNDIPAHGVHAQSSLFNRYFSLFFPITVTVLCVVASDYSLFSTATRVSDADALQWRGGASLG
jgi:hypothetical protein